MIYKIGTMHEIPSLSCVLPSNVRAELLRCTAVLDYEYGEGRNYHQIGGYSLIVETAEDVSKIGSIIDVDHHPPEWVNRIDTYVTALYVLNDDYAVVLFVPLSAAPETILNELEEESK